jgi:probable F420-dependent oxidoreductase
MAWLREVMLVAVVGGCGVALAGLAFLVRPRGFLLRLIQQFARIACWIALLVAGVWVWAEILPWRYGASFAGEIIGIVDLNQGSAPSVHGVDTIELGPLGVVIDIDAGGAHREVAAEIEALGFSTIWIPGGQLDALDRITELIRATTTIAVAPGIIPVDVYPSAAVAQLYTELEATAPGRFVVGLGGPQKPRPLAALGRYLDELDAADPPVPAHRRILAAVGPRKLELARDRAAGAIPLLVNADYTAQARATLGARSTLVIDQMVVLDADPGRARETARGPLRFLSGVAGYRASFARMGFTEAEIDGCSDRLVDELVAWGEPSVIIDRVRAHRTAGADQVVLAVLSDGVQPGPLATARLLARDLLP